MFKRGAHPWCYAAAMPVLGCLHRRAGSGLPPNFPPWPWTCLIALDLPGSQDSHFDEPPSTSSHAKSLVSPPSDSRYLCLGPSQWCPPQLAHKSQTSAGPAKAGGIVVLCRASLLFHWKAGVEWGGDDSTVTNCTLVWSEMWSEKQRGPRWSHR